MKRDPVVFEALGDISRETGRVREKLDNADHLGALPRQAAGHDQADVARSEDQDPPTDAHVRHVRQPLRGAGGVDAGRACARNAQHPPRPLTAAHRQNDRGGAEAVPGARCRADEFPVGCQLGDQRVRVRLDPGLKCSVNAASGSEAEWTVVPAPKPKKLVVVGGGPAGMEAARVAALRGHNVTLYERQGELGGQLILAALPPHKQELALLNRYLARQLNESAVQVKLSVEVTPELLEKDKPDAVILAAGSTPQIPEIPGVTKDKVVTAMDVLSGRVDVGEKLVIIGGELVGCETADFLSQRGKKVTVVRRGPEMASKMFPINRQALLARLKEKGIALFTGIKEYEAITDDGLVIIDGQGKRRTLEADTIVLAAGAITNDHLAKATEGKVGEIHLAGDCVQPRRILDAIHDGARLGREI